MKQFTQNTLFVCVLEICAFILFSVTAHAATYTVTTSADDGAGSLRAAVAAANSTVDDDIINFSIPSSDPNCTADGVCTITLISGQLVVNSTSTAGKLMIVNSTGASNLKVSGNNASRIFFVNSGGDLALSGVTIMNGLGVDGGGIYNNGAITLINLIITGNFATNAGVENFRGAGGGIYNRGKAQLINSIVSGNTSMNNGGGINNGGEAALLTITNSTISDNKALGSNGGIGGGIINSGTLTLTNSTVSGNTVGAVGGGIYTFNNGRATLINSTISGNTAINFGGIVNFGLELTITNSTVTGNKGTSNYNENVGGVYSPGVPANLNNTIIAGNTVPNASAFPDFRGQISSASAYNIIGNDQGMFNQRIFNNTNGNQVGTPANPIDPRLAPLANNGGATQTHALMPDSPAIDKGNTSDLNTDQRGLARPVDLFNYPNAANGDGADIGAFELQTAPTAASVTISGRAITSNGRGLFNALVALTTENGETRYARTSISGRYHFNDVTVGSSVVITVLSKRYSFAPQVLMVTGEALNVDFLAQDGLSKR
ncbi:MAG TPA: carboxypeptidase-like regulatory domain-containing protein [Pyrinomonadaceae bacterium]|jgi:hypothetical protein